MVGKAAVVLCDEINSHKFCIPDVFMKNWHLCLEVIFLFWKRINHSILFQATEGFFRRVFKVCVSTVSVAQPQ